MCFCHYDIYGMALEYILSSFFLLIKLGEVTAQ